jgi:hypothetical protein
MVIVKPILIDNFNNETSVINIYYHSSNRHFSSVISNETNDHSDDKSIRSTINHTNNFYDLKRLNTI